MRWACDTASLTVAVRAKAKSQEAGHPPICGGNAEFCVNTCARCGGKLEAASDIEIGDDLVYDFDSGQGRGQI